MRRTCTHCGFDGLEASWFESPFAEAPDHSEPVDCRHDWTLELDADLPPIRLQ
jgi:hypothetical protein